jgi:LDH2 family malate/lactate/ureidoglycolate dehydrogenase
LIAMNAEIPGAVLEDAITRLFVAVGVAEDNARIVAADLVAADLEGVASHGIMLVPMYLERIRSGSVSATAQAEIVSDRNGTAVIDAKNQLGQLTARRALNLAVAKAKEFGLGAVSARNAFHLGALGLYARMMADSGCIGFATTNTRPLLPAPGGGEAVTGNNPLAIALPSAGQFAAEVDMAMSAVAMGKIRNAAASGNPIPDGWATDKEGKPTTDPKEAIAGMLLPAAGPKGFGLAFVLDILAGGLSDGGIGDEVRGLYGDPSVPYSCSAFFLAIDAGHFVDSNNFKQRTAKALTRVSSSRRAPGVDKLYAPGELAFSVRSAAQAICRPAAATLSALVEAGQQIRSRPVVSCP